MSSTPTSPIRLTITVTPEVHATYQRLAASTGTSLGKTMGEWLESTIEGAEFMASKMEQARAAPALVMREIHAYALGVADETGSIVEKMKERGRADRASLRRTVGAAPVPPSSNTGGKPTEKRQRGAGGVENRSPAK